jgi:ATP-binding cassette, subfamily B, multidrug efflux pump
MMIEEEENLKKIRDSRALRHLWSYTRGLRPIFAFAATLITVSSISHVLSARLLGTLIEQGIQEASNLVVKRAAFSIVGLEVLAVAASFWGRKLLALASLKTMLNVRKALFKHLQSLPMSFIDQQPKGRIVTRMSHDVESMESFFSETLVRLMSAILTMVIVLIGMLLIDFRLGLMVLALMIPTVFLTLAVRGPVRYWNREFAKRNASINSRLSEFLNGIPMIRSLGLEKWTHDQLDLQIDHHLISAMKINRLNSWSRPLIMFFTQLPMAALLGFGTLWVSRGLVPLAHFVSFLRLAERFLHPMNVISQELHVVQTALAHTERVASFLAEKTEDAVFGRSQLKLPHRLSGEIEFQNVTMQYDRGQPALENVSFKIRSGEKIGLVGRTGSGKTTTVSLLSRLYEFQNGEILLDGQSIRNFDRDWLRSQFSVVTQDSILFFGTLRENLLAGGLNPGEEMVLNACRESGFIDLWKKSGLSLDSQILDNGENLSAGERQMLSITRALLLNPSVLVLDEATAQVDSVNERLVHEAVNRLMKNRTCLLIAHRLDTLKECDRILVFKNGHLVEEGARDELLNLKGYFSDLVSKSRSDTEDPETEAGSHEKLSYS